jgi:uncharacterized protein (TIGR02145 family)
VKIGTQCWLAQNLNIGTTLDGSKSQTNNTVIEKYCYDDKKSNCDTYGGLYQWDEMMQYITTHGTQGICPRGWHVPADAEWETLEIALGLSQIETTELSGTNKDNKNADSNASSFDEAIGDNLKFSSNDLGLLHSGYRNAEGSFNTQSKSIYFWSSSENGAQAWYRGLNHNEEKVMRNGLDKAYGCSVRCVRD